MRFGVALHNAYEGLGYPIGFAADPSLFARLARTAETLGYDSVWVNDHAVVPRFLAGDRPHWYPALPTLAQAAAVTTRVRLGTAVIALPLHDPVVLARDAAALQASSGGRLVLGVGLGAFREEYVALGGSRAPRRGILDDGITVLRSRLDAPLYVGGHGERAVDRAARVADGWIPGWQPPDVLRERVARLRETAAAAGRPPVAVALELSARIADRHEDAVREYEESRLVRHRRSRDTSGRDLSLMTASNLVGSAETIRDKVAMLEELGVDECGALAFPAEDEAELVDQWERFARAVRPSGRTV